MKSELGEGRGKSDHPVMRENTGEVLKAPEHLIEKPAEVIIFHSPPKVVPQIPEYPPEVIEKAKLTPRQREIYDLIHQGKTPKEIRDHIGYAPQETIGAIRRKFARIPQGPSELIQRAQQEPDPYPRSKKKEGVPARKLRAKPALLDQWSTEPSALIPRPATAQEQAFTLEKVRTDTPKFLERKREFAYQREKGRMPATIRTTETPPPKEVPSISPRQKEILILTAQGRSVKEISERLCIGKRTIYIYTEKTRQKFGKHSYPSAEPTLTGLYTGVIQPSDVLTESDQTKLETLTERERKILEMKTAQLERRVTQKQIAIELEVTRAVVIRILDDINKKLETKNTTQAITKYAAAKGQEWKDTVSIKYPEVGSLTEKQKEILSLVANGHTGPSIANKLYISQETVFTHMLGIKKLYGVRTQTQAVLKALRHKQLCEEKILHACTTETQDVLDAIDNLKPHEIRFLNALIRNDGANSSYPELERKVKRSIPDLVLDINRKLGTKNVVHLAAVYKSYTMI